jgi:hypothetical protein
MRISTVTFDASLSEFDLPCPDGGEVIEMRMSVHGHCEAVIRSDDGDPAPSTVPVLILREDMGSEGGGPMAGWRHVGSWRYMSGTIAHGFVAVDCLTKTVQAATPKKSKKSPPVDIGSAGQ